MVTEKERADMKTYQKLAAELRTLGLDDMAKEADEGMYHDYLSPHPMPEMKLVHDLAVIATKYPDKATDIMALRRRVINGEFDADRAESDEWAKSKEGIEAFRKLMEGR
jgi:hypothetical protein